MTEKHKTCSFLGHRKIENMEDLIPRVKAVIEELITCCGVSVFLFGSRSDFNNLCLRIVSEFKSTYPQITRIAYTCRSEYCIKESEVPRIRDTLWKITQKERHIYGVDKEFEHKNKYVCGKASYVERNRALIDHSDYCVLYYDPTYLPEKRKRAKNGAEYQPKSGTKLAYEYILQKKKPYINIADT